MDEGVDLILHHLREILEYLNAYGLGGLIQAFVKRYVFRHDTEILAVRSMLGPVPEIQPTRDVAIREATLDDVAELFAVASAHRWKRTRRLLSDWIVGGNPFLVAVSDGEIVGYACITLGFSSRDPLLLEGIGRALDIGPGDAWVADAFILPSHRGNRIYPALGSRLLRQARDAGVRRVVATILADNGLSRSAHRKIGVDEIGTLTFRRMLFWKKVTYQGADTTA